MRGAPGGSAAHRRVAMRQAGQFPFSVYMAVAAGFVGLQVVALLAMGQPPICECGYITLWYGDPSGPQSSQQLTDWYTFTHFVHGFVFYALLWVLAPGMSFGLRFALVIGLEAGWEVIENTPYIIERYRQTALARGYFGDSVINSGFDTVAVALAVFWARFMPVWSSVLAVIGLEVFLALMIRDNLVLNIIQLIYPSDLINTWQAGG